MTALYYYLVLLNAVVSAGGAVAVFGRIDTKSPDRWWAPLDDVLLFGWSVSPKYFRPLAV